MTWNWSDAWLLTSILNASGKDGTGLRGIISAGDYINHSIFLYLEIKEGVQKLLSIKYVRIKDGQFLTTAKFRKDYEALGKHPRGALKATDQLFELLKTKKISEIVMMDAQVLSEAKYEAAYKEYQDSF